MRFGDWTNFYPFRRAWFEMQALDVIGYCIIVVSASNYLIYKMKLLKDIRKAIAVYILLAVTVVVVYPFLMQFAKSLNWQLPDPTKIKEVSDNRVFEGWPDIHVATANPSVLTFILVILVGKFDPLLLYLASGFIGAIIGLCLAGKQTSKRFFFWGFLGSIILLLCGIILVIFNIWTKVPDNIFNKPPDAPIFLIILAGEVAAVFGMFAVVEKRNKAQVFGNNRIVKIFRKWSMLSLTIFVLELYETFVKWLLSLILSPFIKIELIKENIFTGINGFYWSTLVAIFVLLSFHVLVELWSKINFVLSFEWIVVKIQALITKQTSVKIDVKTMMNNIKWINFGE